MAESEAASAPVEEKEASQKEEDLSVDNDVFVMPKKKAKELLSAPSGPLPPRVEMGDQPGSADEKERADQAAIAGLRSLLLKDHSHFLVEVAGEMERMCRKGYNHGLPGSLEFKNMDKKKRAFMLEQLANMLGVLGADV